MTSAARKARHASGEGKGAPTPRRPPRGRTRAQQTMLEDTRRAQIGQMLKDGGEHLGRLFERARAGKQDEQAALEQFMREAGAQELRRR